MGDGCHITSWSSMQKRYISHPAYRFSTEKKQSRRLALHTNGSTLWLSHPWVTHASCYLFFFKGVWCPRGLLWTRRGLERKLKNWRSPTRFKTPLLSTRVTFPSILFFAPSSLLHHFFYFSFDLSITLRITTMTKDEGWPTNGKTPLLRILFISSTMTNNYPFTSFIFRSTLDSLRRWRRR
jgi:hypothetical protein